MPLAPDPSLSRHHVTRRAVGDARRTLLWPVIILFIGSALSVLATLYVQRVVQQDAQARFAAQVDRIQSEIEESFERPQHALNGLVGFYNATRSVGRKEFDAYWEFRNIDREFPGVRSFGFIQPVLRENLAAFVAAASADGLSEYKVRTQGDDPELFLVRHMASAVDNKAALGIDLNVEKVRRAAITEAIQSGTAVLSGAIQLGLPDGQRKPGFLLMQPVYRSGADPKTFAQRRAALVGLVYGAIVMDELIGRSTQTADGFTEFQIFDGAPHSNDNRVFSSLKAHAENYPPFSGKRGLEIAGRTLDLEVVSTPAFAASLDDSRPALVGSVALLLTLLATMGVWQLTRGRALAERQAHRVSAENDRLAKVVQLTNNSVVITDAQGHIEWVNPAFSKLSGFSLKEAYGKNAAELRGTQSSDPAAFATIQQAIAQGEDARVQTHNLGRDGQDYWLDQDIQVLRDEHNQVSGYMAIETDITAEKRAGETLAAALMETAALMNTINIHSIVSEADLAGQITHVNNAFELIGGYSRAELLGRNHRIVNSGLHPAEFWEEMWSTIASGQPWRAEVCNRDKSGKLYWVDSLIAPFVDAQGKVVKYVSICTDITAAKRYQTSLHEARAKAEEATRSKGQFLANMSHEIRTPMNAILGMLSLLQKTDLNNRQADYANKTEGAARSLLGLLNDILDFSKVEAGKMSLDVQPFRLDRLLRDLSVVLSSNVGTKSVEVLFDIDPKVPKLLLGDALRLQQVLINLGGNAVKFTAQGQVVISIRQASGDAPPDTLLFAVQDSGIGIAPENQEHIFSGFSQAEASTSRRFGGTGLGLAISQRLVAVMGGQLQLASALGQGSTFSFAIALPQVQEQMAAADLQLEPTPPIEPRHVLVVDDNPIAGQLMVAMAHSWNWTADLVGSGEEAVQRIRASMGSGAAFPYHVVFLDWQMGAGMDGWETARQLRALTQGLDGPKPTLIMVTAHGRETLSQRTHEEQSWLNGFLVKPVTASMLLDAVVDSQSAESSQSGLRQAARGASQRRLNGLRLLVVEDNLINQQVAEELLNSEGALVSLAANGQLGVEAVLAADPQFDAVLMDLQMPVLDGYAATRVLRTTHGMSKLPIIAMTANAMASDREACLQAGMNDHIGKPFDLNQLVTLLRSYTQTPVSAPPSGLPLQPPASPPSSTAKSDLPPTPGVELEQALARLSGMQSLYVRAARDFVLSMADAPQSLQAAWARHAFDEATTQMHTIKGNAGTLGLPALAAEAGRLETLCRQQTTPGAAANANPLDGVTDTFAQVLHTSLAALQQAIEVLEPPVAPAASTQPTAGNMGTVQVRQDDTQHRALQAALAELAPLLAASDLTALERFTALRPALAYLPTGQLAPLEAALQSLELDQAHALCVALQT
ncbi:MAG: hybrid sensor histidine kinase/response regulator [Comamonadaceae bacterium PBBC2]|nr:MAG: hybrid sensor histidine kinase/response regulator [Comamonadaceae bacterium PBBC2]